MQGGPIFAYETPVVGYPWAIPYEFPVYQIIVALLAATGLPLDAAGRIVAFGFFIGSLWPLRMLFRVLRLDESAFLFVAALFALAPIYVYWSRTFMIETCALFFSLCWLALLARYLSRPVILDLVGAMLAGCIGILAKSTTFPAFAVLGSLLILKESHAALKTDITAARVRVALLAGIAVIVPIVGGGAWSAYADAVRAHNTFAAILTTEILPNWIFGTWSQRLGSELWGGVAFGRALMEIFGYAMFPAIMVIFASLIRREYIYPAFGSLIAYLVPFAVFPTLHSVHNYYQVANALFLIAAVGLALAALVKAGRPVFAFTIFALIAVSQVTYFHWAFAPYIRANYSNEQRLRIAMIAKAGTQPTEALIVIGDEFASTIPYYAQRKSFAIANLIPPTFLKQVLADPQKYLGDRTFGGIVHCPKTEPTDAERQEIVAGFVADRKMLGEFGDCKFLDRKQGG
jgi:hypothetical protein